MDHSRRVYDSVFEMFRDLEERELLKAGMALVESTSGNTGISLAAMAAVKGYGMRAGVRRDGLPRKPPGLYWTSFPEFGPRDWSKTFSTLIFTT